MGIDFSIKNFFYPAGIYRLKQTLDKTQWLPRGELLEYQEQRLAVIVNQAYNHIPYYRRLFKELGVTPADIRHVNDLKKLPLLSKSTVCERNADFIADNAKRYHPVVYSTSGTSGVPMRIHLDRDSRILEFIYYWRYWGWAGYRLGDRFAELRGSFFMHSNNDALLLWQPHVRRLVLNNSQISSSRVKEVAGAIRKYRPKFLKGMASILYFLALNFKQAGVTDISFQAVFSNGEVLTPQYRAMIEQVFDCPVLDSYGHMESAVAISQCMEGGYHINSDYGILEFEDPRPSENEATMVGRAVGTSLYNHVMPFIRYEVGDDIEFFAEDKTCPCGRTLPLVKVIHGRSDDMIITPDGRVVITLYVLMKFGAKLRFAQFIHESPAVLHVNVVPGEMWADGDNDEMLRYMKELTGKEMDVRVHRITRDDLITDPSGKTRTVISYVKQQV